MTCMVDLTVLFMYEKGEEKRGLCIYIMWSYDVDKCTKYTNAARVLLSIIEDQTVHFYSAIVHQI